MNPVIVRAEAVVPGASGGAAGSASPPYLYDPRPDLAADSPAWQTLLEPAFLLDGEAPDGLFGALHGVRCRGARLAPAAAGGRAGPGYRMTPGADYLGDEAAWVADRARWLVPRGDVLTPLLRGLHPAPNGRAAAPVQATKRTTAGARTRGAGSETRTARGDDDGR